MFFVRASRFVFAEPPLDPGDTKSPATIDEAANEKVIEISLSGKLSKENYEHFVPLTEKRIEQLKDRTEQTGQDRADALVPRPQTTALFAFIGRFRKITL